MFAACLRLLLHVVLSPRRLLIAALLAAFCYGAAVATRARLFPESALTSRRSAQPGEQARVALDRKGGPAAKPGAHAE